MGSFSQILSYVRRTAGKKHTWSHQGKFECGLRQNVQAIGKRTATNDNLHSTITRSYIEQAYCRFLDAQISYDAEISAALSISYSCL